MENKNFYFRFYSWWKNIDKSILILIISLFSLGLFFSLVSTSLIASDKLNTNSYYFFIKHLIFIILGFFVLILISFIEKTKLFKISLFLFFVFFVFLILVPFIGIEVKGSRRWIDLPSPLPNFQPIELLKPFFIIAIASVISIKKNKSIYFNYLLSIFVLLPVILLLVMQPDVGQTILLLFTWLSLIFVSGINLIIFFLSFIFFGGIVSYLIFFIPKFQYIQNRILSFFNPTAGNNYQSERASEAIINGGFFGKGVGEGTLNSKVPEAHTDYIVSVISEEFGIIIVLIIILIFLILTYQVFKKINLEKENRVKLILLGSVSILLIQTLIHIGVNINFLPTTGMTLPFLSYGGSSIISTAILSGVILNLTKRNLN